MIETVSIPISTCVSRERFLSMMLSSLARTSTRKHEVILTTEDDERDLISLVDSLSFDRQKLRLRVVHATPISDVFGNSGNVPVYQFIAAGILLASEPWVMVPTGDDSYFPPGWETLLDAVDPTKANSEIWVPRYVSIQPGNGPPNEREVEHGISRPTEIAESELLQYVERIRRPGQTVRESAGTRTNVSWPHAIMHRGLYSIAGGYQACPPHPASQDLHLNDALRDRFGVTSVGVNGSVIVNARVPVVP